MFIHCVKIVTSQHTPRQRGIEDSRHSQDGTQPEGGTSLASEYVTSGSKAPVRSWVPRWGLHDSHEGMALDSETERCEERARARGGGGRPRL